MANYTLSHAILNTAFKSFSVFAIAVAITRLAFLCAARSKTPNYATPIMWLTIEAAVATTLASASSYRVIFLDLLCKRQVQREGAAQKGRWELLNWRRG